MTSHYGEYRYGYNGYGGGERYLSVDGFDDKWSNRGIRHFGSTERGPHPPIEWGYGFEYGEDYG